jgi:tetratricopeptide (TPR) repeat protein
MSSANDPSARFRAPAAIASCFAIATVALIALGTPGCGAGQAADATAAPANADLRSPKDAAERLKRLVEDIRRDPSSWRARTDELGAEVRQVAQFEVTDQRVLARNNVGALFLDLNVPDEALKYLQPIEPDLPVVKASLRYRCAYNLGRAYELTGDDGGAYRNFLVSLRARRGYDPATAGIGRVLDRRDQSGVAGAVRGANDLVQAGEFDLANWHVHAALERLKDDPQAPQLLGALVRCYVAAEVDPSRYADEEEKRLDRVGKSAMLGPAIDELDYAFGGKMKPALDAEGKDRFPSWSKSDDRASFAELLRKIANHDAATGRPEDALARYLAARRVDPRNAGALVAAFEVLLNNGRKIDPEGSLLRQLTDRTFSEKMDRYAIAGKTTQDWIELLRLHTVLATVYERAPDAGRNWSPDNPRGAAFQWRNAVRVDDRIRQDDPAFPPSSAIYERCRNCFQQAGRVGMMFSEYLSLAESDIQLEKREAARVACDNAAKFAGALTPDQVERLKSVRSRVEALPAAPVTRTTR